MINGVNYDFESIKIQLPSGVPIMAAKISYEDSKDDEIVNNRFGIPVGVGRGEYKLSGNLELGYYDYQNLKSSLVGTGGGFYNVHAVPISIAYADPGEPIHTVSLIVKFNKRSFDMPEKQAIVKLDFEGVAPLVEDAIPAYIPGAVTNI